ncbi:type II toxin-antitoxin system RelE/ParE family toxin [Allofranklinella schreckenbergeri]|uniref:type II toxin-antitoxin system RelE/ParE family toxin n=1 Tax=Allofranklinella schreckenbergeri TaxID=1076744 RepID=UPI001EEDEB45|nr:type II toxin-antitoxin system RelE/ParE family toxin [Allofranklinella schreckenbergeri]
MERVVDFLATKNPQAAERALLAIADQLEKIKAHPAIYRPVPSMPKQREAVLAFGTYGYVIRYLFDSDADLVYVLRVWHQLECKE